MVKLAKQRRDGLDPHGICWTPHSSRPPSAPVLNVAAWSGDGLVPDDASVVRLAVAVAVAVAYAVGPGGEPGGQRGTHRQTRPLDRGSVTVVPPAEEPAPVRMATQ